jgi:hypothetical protein
LWAGVEPRRYPRQIDPVGLIKSFMLAFVLGLPGLRAVAARGTELLSGCNHSALSHAVRRRSMVELMQALLAWVTPRDAAGDGGFVAIDSMPLTLPATVQHGCARINRTTVGGGVLWAFAIDAARGMNPVRVLKVIEGPWHDACLMDDVDLVAAGPIYLMDRGFYAIDLVARWIERRVRFIVRAKCTHLRYEVEEQRGAPRRVEKLRLTLDAIVRLGGPDRLVRRKACPRLRMVRAVLSSGEELILVSNLMDQSAEYLLESYRQRWQIERFHYYLKETLGLAHLYSFQQNGLAFLVQVAVLLCVLLLLVADAATKPGLTVDRLRSILKSMRLACGFYGLWRRNTMTKGQTRHLKKQQNL